MPDVNNVQKFVTPAQFASYVKPLRNAVDALVLIVRDHDVITPSATSWADVQAIVRAGLADKAFPIGTKMYCHRGNDLLEWDVIGIDHDTPADPQFTHSLTLQLHDCFPTLIQFDAPEAFYYCGSALEAKTYYFTVNGTNYQFTLESAIAEGSQLILNFTDNTPTSIFVSAAVGGDFVKDPNDTDNNLTIAVTAGGGGDELTGVNNVDRTRYGSNNYKESAIRQWLNKSKVAGPVWTAQNNFDRPPTWYTDNNTAGFVDGMDADFLAVLGRTHIVTARNTVDGGGYDETDDFFFLPSGKEVYFMDNPAEGVVYPYYSDFSDLSSPSGSADANRVKNKGTAAAVWWLRTPIQNTAGQVFRVMDDGRRSSDTAFKNYYTAPVCNII